MKKNIIAVVIIMMIALLPVAVKAQNTEDAIRLSHAGKYDEAERIFNKLIIADAKNTRLLIASGFNNAWNKKYLAAKNRFRQALELESGNEEAAKGLAYTYLYNAECAKAADAFNKLSAAHFNNEEYHFALGLAYMNMQKKSKAYLQFEKVLELNNANAHAQKFMDEIQSGKKILELSSLVGITGFSGETRFGLRQIQLGYHVNNEVLVYARYDNALSQDNYFFLKNNFRATALFGGVYSRWHNRAGSRFEYGYRSFPGKVHQNIFQTEQIIFLPKNFSVKLGGSVVNTTDETQNEWMLMGGLSVPAGNKIKIEP
jgi:tetratricopeptide (TPR) repeat protein